MNFRRILLTRMKYIGDVVLTTPIIRALRDAYPDAHLAYLGDAKAVSLLRNNPYLDEIIPFDFKNDHFLYQASMYWRMFRGNYDLTIDLYSNPRSALMTFATRAMVRIGGDTRGRGKLYTIRVGDDGTLKSAILHHYQSLKPLGIAPSHTRTEIFLDDAEKAEASALLGSLGVDGSRPIVALHPGATWPNKVWLKEQFRGLIGRLLAESECDVLLSPGPNDGALMDYLREGYRNRVHPLPLLPVRELAAVLSHCRVFVANDCGPMHIGVAVGAKTIGIFGPEPPEIWFPYDRSAGHLPMFRKLECSPCRTTACHRQGAGFMECMTSITVNDVLHAVKERL
ncbi:MAG: glycosyltransferase family 9 protein [Bacteroidetes bacterium]|nr:glycosyltransferase family 9 protein [Bacteroidota bacterium]